MSKRFSFKVLERSSEIDKNRTSSDLDRKKAINIAINIWYSNWPEKSLTLIVNFHLGYQPPQEHQPYGCSDRIDDFPELDRKFSVNNVSML